MAIKATIVNAVEKHKAIRRIILFWAMTVNTYAIFMYFDHIKEINAAVTSGFVAVIGLMNTILGLYNWQRHKEELANVNNASRAPGN